MTRPIATRWPRSRRGISKLSEALLARRCRRAAGQRHRARLRGFERRAPRRLDTARRQPRQLRHGDGPGRNLGCPDSGRSAGRPGHCHGLDGCTRRPGGRAGPLACRTRNSLGRSHANGWPTGKRSNDGKRDTLVITGFVAATADGVPATLGRNGSDYSASIFGALLDAQEIHIWSDVDGVMSADPRLVADAVVLEALSYQEAAELAYFGARLVHPATHGAGDRTLDPDHHPQQLQSRRAGHTHPRRRRRRDGERPVDGRAGCAGQRRRDRACRPFRE